MTYQQIFDEYEGKYRIQNNEIYRKLLEEFKKCSGIDWRAVAEREKIASFQYKDVFWALHSLLFNHEAGNQFIPLFYQTLEHFGYNLTEDYVSFVRLIGQYTEYGLSNCVRNFVVKAPYIEKVIEKKGTVTVHSEQLGNITFCSIKKYFGENYFMKMLLQDDKVKGQCHNVSWSLMDYMPGSTLVTSLMSNSFVGTAYHSVIRDKDGFIVDAASSCVYKEKDYHQLFQDEIICETREEKRYEDLSRTSLLEGRNMANALVLALHEQKKKL